MVESSKAKINFIKLNSQELSTKIALLVSNRARVVFWKISPRYFEGAAASFQVHNKIRLNLDKLQVPVKLISENICLNFTLNGIDYFLRGKVLEQDQEQTHMSIELGEECFRVEKRTRERLIAFPVYNVYVYFKFPKKENPNIIFLNKKEQKNIDFFAEIDNLQKNQLAQLGQDLQLSENEDIVGFRVEDISSNGLSFFANPKENELVLESLENDSFSLILVFEKQVFHLEDASFVYKINYINAQFAGISMLKIGINFKLNMGLKRIIEDVSGITIDLVNYQKEFEEFIKNE